MKLKSAIICQDNLYKLHLEPDFRPKLQRYLQRLHKRGLKFVVLEVKGETKSTQQLRTVYALMRAWQDTGAHSAPEFVVDRESFKLWCKYFWGTEARQGFSTKDKSQGLKSLADYSKWEAQQFIESLLSVIRQSGAQSQKLDEIYAGMEMGGYGL